MFCVLWEFDLLDLDISGTGGVQSPTTGTSIPTFSHGLPSWACGDVLRAVVVSKPKRGKETDKPPRFLNARVGLIALVIHRLPLKQ